MEVIEFKNEIYPAFQASGFSARFCFPFAKEICKGNGYDVGCNRTEWALPGSVPIDPYLKWCPHDALNLPDQEVDYIFSSHCLEHLPIWVKVLDYWWSKLKPGGVIFLYLPDFSQKYWRGWHNTKHVNMFTPEIIKTYFTDQPDFWENIFCSGVDLNHSFICVATKTGNRGI